MTLSTSSSGNVSALIIGAGVGGLSSAVFLKRLGYDVTVFEQAQELGPVGAGILLPPSGQAVLRELGVFDRVANASAVITGVRAELAGGERLLDLRYETLSPTLRALGTPRHVLFEALRTRAEDAGVKIETNSRVDEVLPLERGARVIREQGRALDSDFVVVCDGSRSAVGEKLKLRRFERNYDHQAVWTTGTTEDSSRDFLLQRMNGVKRLSGLLPLGHGRASFFWGVRKDELLTDWQSFRSEALTLMPEAKQIIDQMSVDHTYTRVGYRTTIHYPWHVGDVVLLGDAAHSMSPHLGQGAGLALVDAARLAKALRESPEDRRRAFRNYQRDRFWKTLYYSFASGLTSPFFQSDHSILAPLRNFFLPFLQRFPWIERQMISTMSGLKSNPFVTQMKAADLDA